MARILLIHNDRGPRKLLEARAGVHHDVKTVENLGKAMRAITSFRPELLLVGVSPKRPEGLDLLRYLKRNRIDIPAVVVGPAQAGALQPMLMKLGAAAFVEFPMEQATLDQVLSNALQTDKETHGQVPPISPEELNGNISDLEKQLNRRMACFAGKNQVYIQSTILGGGRTSKPRTSLKCPLRKQFGHPPNVYYEYIRDVCCGDPAACPAYQEFKARYTA
ncbi:MAG: hypothetical protein ACE5E6_03070 [Phycisphaerae bacterium]